MLEITTDLQYNLYYFLFFLNGIICLFAMIVWHELGHIFYFKINHDKDVKVYFSKGTFEVGKDFDYNILSKEDYNAMLLYGLISGLIPYLLLVLFNKAYIFMILAYAYGCRSDLKQVNLDSDL